MNKRVLALVMVLALAVSGAFAAPFLQIGPTVFYHQQVWDSEKSEVILPESFGAVTNNIGIGADVRVNLGMLQLAAFADCGMPFGKDLSVLTMNGGVSVNTVLSLAFLDAFVGAGAGAAQSFADGDFKRINTLSKSLKRYNDVLEDYEKTFTDVGTPKDANVNLNDYKDCPIVNKASGDVIEELKQTEATSGTLENMEAFLELAK
jgi:hypothetical protein